ncbi:hypothetical protein K492DRAFT_202592 [Lichtheimia hyalospora FSU 10163]|nr:hypothetical protein K492DRAFT_202592 [Lichtheimia hyalospora FSU 10163]
MMHIPSTDDDHAPGCQILDGFAIVVQLTLAMTALTALGIKRWRERPRRPVNVWILDVSKQFIGAGTVHFLNLGISYLAGRPANGPPSNLCVWYFLSLLIDTTLGIAILWFWLRILEWTLEHVIFTSQRQQSKRLSLFDGYGPPPFWPSMLCRWSAQTGVFVLATLCMKICIYASFQAFPVIFDLGDWVLAHIKETRYQVVFVMFVFPLFMNAFQFCVIDSIIKGTIHPPRYCQDPSLWANAAIKETNNRSNDDWRGNTTTMQPNHNHHDDERTPLLSA